MNIITKFLKSFNDNANQIAISEANGNSITYAELSKQVLQLAVVLSARGLQPGHKVVLQLPNGIKFAIATLAVLMCGATVALCDPGLGAEIYYSQFNQVQPDWLIQHPLLPKIAKLQFLLRCFIPDKPKQFAKNRCVIFSDKLLKAVQSQAQVLEVAPYTDAVIIFTSGTTSKPKGVVHSHYSLINFMSNINQVIADCQVQKLLADTPAQLLYGLYFGKSVVVFRGRKDKKVPFFQHAITKGLIDSYFGAPHIWQKILQQLPVLPETLQTILLGSAPVTKKFLQLLQSKIAANTKVKLLYGLTEIGPVSAATLADKLSYQAIGDFVGFPLAGVKLTFANQEIVAQSAALFSRYLGQSQATSLYTGDLGKLVSFQNQQALVLLGRKKDMIIRCGINIYPGTIEPIVRALPGVEECALVGIWNNQLQDEILVLFVQPVFGKKINITSIKQELAVDVVPDHIIPIKTMPVSGRQNKIDKKILRTKSWELLCKK